ncbi:hypothetical protein TSTA_078750 [Talaromyces stipitatus ATCC 10500]|uniref:Uncharacterized protein n=1 Tax=Talaromyces stipitatus (strain ATCC 10500 / CBS 375.48 / QM 6759 / NRRL 1006) TaxID=441959 RepID=B8LXL9_TALSN|nr:uncharacterized protein TSTA_078750 [Talaromyces stipitatus ATCC 10500]EED24520.1 hypothetical protein TSTA_078750 [Talaromyces stipitatus ATCC 10500]
MTTEDQEEPFEYFAKVTLGIVCFIWFLATLFCTPVGRWLRCQNPRARRPFFYNPGGCERPENDEWQTIDNRRPIEADPASEVWPVGGEDDSLSLSTAINYRGDSNGEHGKDGVKKSGRCSGRGTQFDRMKH